MYNVKENYEPQAYPPPPWQLHGKSWLGFFRTDRPLTIPPEYHHILGSRIVQIAIIRYLSGTLSYDEMIIGSMVRYGFRFGLYVHHIWVDDYSSLWGGRQIWGLNKQMAEFSWLDDQVSVSDELGFIGRFKVDLTDSKLPSLWMPMPSFGQLPTQRLFTVGSIHAHFGSAGMSVLQWSERFSYHPNERPLFAIAGKPFSMVFNPPKFID